MRFLPYYFETLVLPISSERVVQILAENTKQPKDNSPNSRKFSGYVDSESFRISEKLDRPDNFMPLIRGTVEKTSKGSIVFTSYNLLFPTALFVSFWSIVTLLLSLLFLFEYNNILYSVLSLAAFILNYLFTSSHFHRKVRILRQTFYSLFTE